MPHQTMLPTVSRKTLFSSFWRLINTHYKYSSGMVVKNTKKTTEKPYFQKSKGFTYFVFIPFWGANC